MQESEIIEDLRDRIVKFVKDERYSKALDLITTLMEYGEKSPDFDKESWEKYEKQIKELQNKDM
ncbi:MAG: hypothetical protein INQ03_23005 [Candidatus Heimdallarchaeota archaeon]|nr:hypothetical protein [Candidatus Heimdallarchaeota archaeon]